MKPLIRDIQIRTNFGFAGTREAAVLPAGNAKLSEYHAAVGLAALDEWSEDRNEWIMVAQAYRDVVQASNRLCFQNDLAFHGLRRLASSNCTSRLPRT